MKRYFIIGTFLTITLTILVFVIMGQNNNNNNSNSQRPQKPDIIGRFERVIKNKETKYVQGKVRFGERIGNMKVSSMDWKLHEEGVFLYIHESNTPQEAQELYNEYLNAPLAVPVATTKLTNLGDEAFFRTNGVKIKSTNLVTRKGNIVLTVTSNNINAAKRFGRHLIREIEKRDRGEP